ncbi:exodeoxyribonuclease VII small subunit [Haloimpatiens sp. FM7330]|uniref:exodeoxyribonuclease VII small subunit n=1 Tax=Haloimpatiens sp. FM7330 TaxID=3298610 RepID=UPI00362CEB11
MAKKKSYEEMMSELENVINLMENNDVSLEDAIKNYEKGMKLYYKLYKRLDEAEGKIKILNEHGEENFLKEDG